MARVSRKEVIEYLRSKGGSATVDEMRADNFGDVGRGWDTIRLLQKLRQEGILEREIEHTPERQTIIRWLLKRR